jgi:hypothetical protein
LAAAVQASWFACILPCCHRLAFVWVLD